MKHFAVFATALVLSVSLHAQTPDATCKDAAKPAPGQNISCMQKLELENNNLKIMYLQQQANVQQSPFMARKQELIKKIEEQNPGFQWVTNQQTGQELGLQPIQKATPPAPAPPPPAPAVQSITPASAKEKK